MKQFNNFYFESTSFDSKTLTASFSYSFDEEIFFTEKINFWDNNFQTIKRINKRIINNLLFHLQLALGISYYKTFPTNNLIIKSWFLTDDQIVFWRKFYQNWLWEFLFRNQIEPNKLFNFVNTKKIHCEECQKIEIEMNKYKCKSDKAILPFGGGKDSIVSFELLEKMWIKSELFSFGKDYEAHKWSAELIWKKRMIIQREIDPKLFEMNQSGYFNGHVPITWIISFVLTMVSYIYDYKYIVFSNEKSADVENLKWKWLNINHQYSKSVEFEKDFWDYIKKYISDDLKYFSLLNGFFELNIAKLFSKYPKYFTSFVSCNNNFKVIEKNKYSDQRRCLACPKCYSVFCMLNPRLEESQILEIFWKDLYQDNLKVNDFRELLWIKWHKPFECVWTTKETALSMYYSYKNYVKNKEKLPPVLEMFQKEILPTLNEKTISKLEKEIFTRHEEKTIPTEIVNKLKKVTQS